MQLSRKLFQIWDMELSKKLTQLKDKRGVSERQIARSLKELSPEIKVSPTTVNRWLVGDGIPDLEQAVALAEYFGVPITYLAYADADSAPGELPEDEAAVLRVYRNLKRAGALNEASATHGLALAASSTAPSRIAPGATTTLEDEDLPEAGFEKPSGGHASGRGTPRGKRSG